MTYEGPADLAPAAALHGLSGGVGQLEYQSSGAWRPSFVPFVGGRSDAAQMDLNLHPNVPITSLTMQTGATDAHLDLSSLQVSTSTCRSARPRPGCACPQAAGLTTAHISGGASTHHHRDSARASPRRSSHRGGLSTVNVDQNRFPQVSDSLYRSPDYDDSRRTRST